MSHSISIPRPADPLRTPLIHGERSDTAEHNSQQRHPRTQANGYTTTSQLNQRHLNTKENGYTATSQLNQHHLNTQENGFSATSQCDNNNTLCENTYTNGVLHQDMGGNERLSNAHEGDSAPVLRHNSCDHLPPPPAHKKMSKSKMKSLTSKTNGLGEVELQSLTVSRPVVNGGGYCGPDHPYVTSDSPLNGGSQHDADMTIHNHRLYEPDPPYVISDSPLGITSRQSGNYVIADPDEPFVTTNFDPYLTPMDIPNNTETDSSNNNQPPAQQGRTSNSPGRTSNSLPSSTQTSSRSFDEEDSHMTPQSLTMSPQHPPNSSFSDYPISPTYESSTSSFPQSRSFKSFTEFPQSPPSDAPLSPSTSSYDIPPPFSECRRTSEDVTSFSESHRASEEVTSRIVSPGARGRNNGPRYDSGVEDCESSRGSLGGPGCQSPGSAHSPGSTPPSGDPPRLTTLYEQHYEDIDQYCRRGNTGPPVKPRSSIDKTGGAPPSRQARLPKVTVTEARRPEGGHVEAGGARSPAPPTSSHAPHDTAPHAPLPSFSPAGHKPSSGGVSGCCVASVLCVVFCISLTALGISVYLLLQYQNIQILETHSIAAIKSSATTSDRQGSLSTTTTASATTTSATTTSATTTASATTADTTTATTIKGSSSVDPAMSVTEQLMKEIDLIKAENKDLRTQLLQFSQQIKPLAQSLTSLQTQQRHVNTSLYGVQASLEGRIQDISLTPGPQGAPGVANFSLCTYGTHTKNSWGAAIQTQFYPSEEALEHQFPLFAFCKTDGYTGISSSHLTTTAVGGRMRYACVCGGGAKDDDGRTTQRKCTISYWLCPT